VYPLKVEFTERPGVVSEGDVHAGSAKGGRAAGRERVRIGNPDDDPAHAGPNQSLSARRGATGVRAGLQGDVGGGATSGFSRHGESDGLRVGAARPLVPALSHDLAVAHEDTPHDRVGSGGPASALREFTGATQVRVGDNRVRVAEVASHCDILLPSGL
jgi:hypothetical protein